MIPPMFFEDGSHTFKSPGLSDGGLACTECPEGTGVSGPLGLSDRGAGRGTVCTECFLITRT